MIKIKHTESGRSMAETLAVLAIIMLLSIVAMSGYNRSVIKERANKIAHDSQTCHTLIAPLDDETEDWTAISNFIPESQKNFSYLIDKVGHRYIKVEGVEKDVCKELLSIAGRKLKFYTTENAPFEECENVNSMIMDFDNNGLVAECTSYSDCEGEEAYCSNNNQCGNCPDGRKANEDKNGCLCDPKAELSCSDKNGNTWCCGENTDGKPTICGTELGENQCVESDGKCSYTFYANGSPDTTFYTDCSFTVSDTDNVEKYYGDCNYVVATTGNTAETWTDGTGTNRNIYPSTSGNTYVAGTKCTGNRYCTLLWQDTDGTNDGEWEKDKTTSFAAGSTGVIWGKCQMLSSYDTTPKAQYTTGYGLVNKSIGCDDDQFCSLLWTQETWEQGASAPNVQAGSTGTLYGKCQMLSSWDTTPLSRTDSDGNTRYAIEQSCPANQYCYLNWSTDQSCTAAGAGITGEVFGVCSKLNTQGSCPYAK